MLQTHNCQACGFVISVAWGLPFSSQEEDNEFLGLKRIPYPANWHAVTVSEQVPTFSNIFKIYIYYSISNLLFPWGSLRLDAGLKPCDEDLTRGKMTHLK